MISDFIRRWFGFTGYNPFSRWQMIRSQKIDAYLTVGKKVVKTWEAEFIVEHHLEGGVRGYIENHSGNLSRIENENKITQICKSQSCSCT